MAFYHIENPWPKLLADICLESTNHPKMEVGIPVWDRMSNSPEIFDVYLHCSVLIFTCREAFKTVIRSHHYKADCLTVE
jgi:hypothetical protein